MEKPKTAFLFDLNGTMVDDMDYHIRAWHRILNELGAGIDLGRMKLECYGKNNEVIERILPGKFSADEKDRMSEAKEKEYRGRFKPHLKLLPGLNEFLARAFAAGIPMAIGSAAIMSNVDFVIDNLGIRHFFGALVSADNVKMSKPDPETFLSCANQLNSSPADCIVFEDAPKGVESAQLAGMRSVVITLMHPKEDFSFPNIIRFIKNYQDLLPEDLVVT